MCFRLFAIFISYSKQNVVETDMVSSLNFICRDKIIKENWVVREI